jgi:hypothetical protein
MTNNVFSSQFTKLEESQKNQILVALMSAMSGSYRNMDPFRAAVSGVSIDLLSESALKLFNFHEDSSIFDWNK